MSSSFPDNPAFDNLWHGDWLLIGKDRFDVAATLGPGEFPETWIWDPDGSSRGAQTLSKTISLWAMALRERWWQWSDEEGRWIHHWDRIPAELQKNRLL